MSYQRYGALSSSVDPNKLAKTVEGAIKFLAGGATLLGYGQVVGDLNHLAEVAGAMSLAAFALWGLAETAYGLVRKVVVALADRG